MITAAKNNSTGGTWSSASADCWSLDGAASGEVGTPNDQSHCDCQDNTVFSSLKRKYTLSNTISAVLIILKSLHQTSQTIFQIF